MAAPAPSNASAKTSGKSLLTSPWVLGAGAVAVLLVLVKGSGGSSGGSGGATASAVQQAVSEEQEQVRQALAAAKDDNTGAMADNAARLANSLDLFRSNEESALSAFRSRQDAELAGVIGRQQAADQAQANTIANLSDAWASFLARFQSSTQPLTAGIGGGGGGPRPSDSEIRTWANGLRPDNPNQAYTWGTAMVNHYGRLPSSIPELTAWLHELGL